MVISFILAPILLKAQDKTSSISLSEKNEITMIKFVNLDTILIDFGSNASPLPWNNFTSSQGEGDILSLLNSKSDTTKIGCKIYDRFNNINFNGTNNPAPSLGLPSTASNDSYYGNIAVWQNLIEPTAGLLFTGLDTSFQYTFEIFASRMGVSDNRETKYKFIASKTDSVYLNPANNENKNVTITLQPTQNGSIDLILSPGENNNNTYNFFYIGALKLISKQKEIVTPTVTVTSPNGGEEWIKGTTKNISWMSNDIDSVKIEFSKNNGTTWELLKTVFASLRKFEWTIPNINTDSALIRISAIENPLISDVSDNVFRIDDPINGENRPLIVVLGSSTAEGVGATTKDSSWVGRFRNYVKSSNPKAYVVNLAVGGFTSYHVMPTGFVPSSGRPNPQIENNISKALTFKPWGVIVNLPSNDAANSFTLSEQISNMNLISQTSKNSKVPMWITTTQPRNFSQFQRDLLIQMRNYILLLYGDYAINIFDSLANSDGTIKNIFSSGDGIHINNSGHKVIFNKIVEAQVWEKITTDVIDFRQGLPTIFALNQNYPNPFNPSTTIGFSLPVNSKIEIAVYDLLGRKIDVLASGNYSAGNHNFIWDASRFAGGMYIYRMVAYGNEKSNYVKTMKMLFLK